MASFLFIVARRTPSRQTVVLLHLDEYFAVLFGDSIGADRVDARWFSDFTGPNIKCAIMEVAFNVETIQKTLT